ncbi:MAG TPA: L,D-transpeptidase family protein [Terriglobales bacterium]|jgi:murein L,D-transpeptidase YcbB/YkuD|nr:L,D-transpeptidase family protein [Terriglobales bacterium]
MKGLVFRPRPMIVLTIVVVAGMLVQGEAIPSLLAVPPDVFAGQSLSPAGVSALRGIADSARNADLRWSDFTPYKAEFAKFYETNSYSLVWVQNGRVRSQGLAVIELLQNANAKGLDPEDYDGSRWQGRLLKLGQKPSEQDLISFDTALTVSTMRYIRAVHCGRVNPKEFKFQLDVEGLQLPLAEFIQTQVVNAADPAAEIQKLEPPFLGYRKLLALLPVYEGYAKQAEGEQLPPVTKTVRPGQPYAGVVRLGRFLQVIGDIPANVQLNPNATVYEGALVDGVKHYQDRHGETPTGNLDARTINELNTPPAARIRQIKLTLERWRWIPHSFPTPPVVVNLPEYRVRAMNPDGTVAFYKNVIIGKAYGHKSPVFEKEIQYVVFRPYWEVTPSIQRSEIVPHIQKDPNYIAKHDFEVVTPKGEVVTDNQVSPEVLEGIKSGHLMVRQKPGDTNSLGLVKIIFPNPDNVYLHGTDVPELFSQDVRDFSHGCIRVQQPADLVAWVLRNNPGWDLERVKATMNGEKNNIQVNLVTRIPVLIVYGTATVNEENQIRFFDDIYGYDAELEKALAAGYPYAW